MLNLLAFDYGASSGRAMLGSFDGGKLTLEEIHRFSNDPVNINGTFYWDILRLFHEMKQGILKSKSIVDGDISGIGTDTWGVDYGLLDGSGQLLGNPVHYRDSRTEGMIEKACATIPHREIYNTTGIAFQKFNTLYQLLSMANSSSSTLKNTKTMLFTPDLLNYFLTGIKSTEFTIASTSQMLDAKSGTWALPMLEKLGIPCDIFTDIAQPGTIVGRVSDVVGKELNASGIPVIAVAQHDTASAVVAVPSSDKTHAYLSSGTWSLLGVESSSPVINDDTYNLNYTNEGGFDGTTRLLKNIMGLWIYQECKRTWDREEEKLTFDELEDSALNADEFVSLIDPNDDLFYSPGNMPAKVAEYCKRTGQIVPQDKPAVVRCIMESLALAYRIALEGIEEVIGERIPVLHIVGGGCRNKMLSKFTASCTGRPVEAGPIEATAIGNLCCQLIALGEASGVKETREIIKRSFPIQEYLPENAEKWNEAYVRFRKLTRCAS
jgi:rhamnulokinase